MIYRNPFTGRPFAPRFNIPEVFGQCLSYEDQILWLAKHFKELADYVESLNLEHIREEMLEATRKQTHAMLDAFMVPINRRLDEMEKKIDGYVAGALMWDPTQGAYVPSKIATRRIYAALVQSGNSHVSDMADLTVDDMSRKTVHAYSVAAKSTVDWSDEI